MEIRGFDSQSAIARCKWRNARGAVPITMRRAYLIPTASLALPAIWSNAAGSAMAISESDLRFSVILAFRRPLISCE